jgi:hypothetical protein
VTLPRIHHALAVPLALALALPLALGACGAEDGSSESSDLKACKGAKLDAKGKCRAPNGAFASAKCCAPAVEPESLDCNVVWVDLDLNGDLLEEGLGSQFDVDAEGFPQADSDSTTVRVDIEAGSSSLSIGQHGWSSEDGDAVDPLSETPEVNDETELRSFVAKRDGDAETYKLRVFTKNELGVVLHKASAKAREEILARVDCRGLDQPDHEGEPVTAADHDCDVVWVDEGLNAHLLEEGLGSLYDFDEEGFPQADEDSTSVSVETSGGELFVRVGQMSFRPEDGDRIEVVEEEPEFNDDTGFQTVTAQLSGSEDIYKVRIFTASQLGVVLHQEGADGEATQLATIDCRGLDRPDLF